MIDVTKLSTTELLVILLGKDEVEKLKSTNLDTLIRLRACSNGATVKLRACRELMARWLEERIAHRPLFADPKGVRDYLRITLSGEEREIFMALFLDTQNRLLASEKLFYGTLAQTSVYPREVVKRALQLNAGAVIFAHNHPSGIAEPSRSDEVLTASLKHALSLVDVRVIDHFVIGDTSAMSFAERGLL